jgi:hypothetical protein
VRSLFFYGDSGTGITRRFNSLSFSFIQRMINPVENKPPSTPTPSSPLQNRLLIAAVILIGLLIFGELWRRISQASELRILEGRVGAQVTQLAKESNLLSTQIADAQSDEEVAKWAHSQGKMVLPGEILVMPLTPAPQPTSTPTAYPSSTQLSNWKIWWEWLWGAGE